MRLSELKKILEQSPNLKFQLPDGSFIPQHFHITEVGKLEKHFIDCGGTVRNETNINLQLWYSTDTDHRLESSKLLSIIHLSEDKLGLSDAEIEVEYQADTIGKYGLSFENDSFQLTAKQTDCLAMDNCGIPQEKPKIRWSAETNSACCTPESGCC